MPRRSQPSKDRIFPQPLSAALAAKLESMGKKVVYEGHPHHKANPLDYGLKPPASPRENKTLCDSIGPIRKAQAERFLKKGFRTGLVSGDWDGETWPKRLWYIGPSNQVFEAKLHAPGRYHGFPLKPRDAFASLVLRQVLASNTSGEAS